MQLWVERPNSLSRAYVTYYAAVTGENQPQVTTGAFPPILSLNVFCTQMDEVGSHFLYCIFA